MKEYIRNRIRLVIRRLLLVKTSETITDAIDRHITKIERRFFKQKFNREELYYAISACGIKTGDTIMVHSSWRKFYNFDGTPKDVIEVLDGLVGKNGTILMPCYGADIYYFDVDNTPSNAGVLSEVFRKFPQTKRSKCTHFSVAARGKLANYLIESHDKSKYGFDIYSPCYKLRFIKNSKVLFLGLGKVPTKISVFHCAGSFLRNSDKNLNKLLSNNYCSKLIVNGIEYNKQMYTRVFGHPNDNAVFKRIFGSLSNKRTIKLSNLYITVIDAEEAINKSIEFARKGEYCYKNMNNI